MIYCGVYDGKRHKGVPINDSRPFDEAERKRFHNLLLLANESPYEGAREAALAAAKRMAKARGMTRGSGERRTAAAAPETDA